METVTDFKYLGQDFTTSDDNCPAVVDNIQKARSRWVHFPGFWGGRGQTPGILFGSETWVANPRIGRTLGGFHQRMACSLVEMQLKQNMARR